MNIATLKIVESLKEYSIGIVASLSIIKFGQNRQTGQPNSISISHQFSGISYDYVTIIEQTVRIKKKQF